MAFTDCDMERERPKYPPRDDGARCDRCRHGLFITASIGRCRAHDEGVYSFMYCDEYAPPARSKEPPND